jgi:hypothetical protein
MITNGYATLAEVKERFVNAHTYTAATISFDNATKKISDTAYGMKRFKVAEIVQVSGTTNNNGFFTVATVNAAGGFITVSESVVTEIAGASVTVKLNLLPEYDAGLESTIEAVSRWIDSYTGRTFYSRTAETRRFDVPDVGDKHLLMLDDDLISVTTLTNGDAEVLTTADYVLLPANGTPKYAIKIKDISSKFWSYNSDNSTEQVITVVGSWGYSATAPLPVKEACILESIRLFKRKDAPYGLMGMSPAGGEVVHNIKPDPMIERLLAPYRRLV